MRSIGLYLFIGAYCVGLAILSLHRPPPALPVAFSSLVDSNVSLQGMVVALPDIRETSDRLTVEVRQGKESTRIIASAALYPEFHVGDIVRVSGKLEQPEPFDTDGGRTFAYDRFLQKDGVYGVIQPAQVTRTGKSRSLWLRLLRAIEYSKNLFTSALERALPEPESALAVGIIVGGKQGLGTKLIDQFTIAGMLQIVVLSGYNVVIVANGIMQSLTFLPKRIASIVAGVAISLFVLAGGAGASAVRAGIMACFALLARTTGKQYDVMRMLAVALFLLVLWKPLSLLYDPGLQFSFLATVGLILGSPLILARLTFIRSLILRDMLATTLAAQLGVLPLLLWQTGNLSLVAIPANLLAMPVIPFAMASGALAALFAFPLGLITTALPALAGLPAYAALWYVIHVATISASLPLAQVILPQFPFWMVGASYAGLAFLVVRLRKEPDAVRRRASSH